MPAGEKTVKTLSVENREPENGSGPSNAPGARLLDLRIIALSFGGNKDLIQKSMKLYLIDAPVLIDKLVAALADNNPTGAAAEAHALKGISGYFTQGAPYRLAMDLDKLSRQASRPEDYPKLRRLAALLKASVDELTAEMNACLFEE